MADDDDDAFTFSDFKSAPPQSLQNGDVFAHLFFTHTQPQFRPQPDPFPTPPDPAHKPNGPTPTSLFGSIDHIDESGSNGWFNSKPNGQIRVSSDSIGVGSNNIDDIFGKFVDIPNNQIQPVNGSGLNFGGLGLNFDGSCLNSNNVVENEGEEDDEWEFKGADFDVLNSLEKKGQSLSCGSKVEVVLTMEMQEDKQAGQDASISTGYEPGPSNSLPQSVDLFSLHNGAVDKSNEMDFFNFNFTPFTTNGFTSSLFPGSQEIDNDNKMSANSVIEDDDVDDFGDFVDASQDVQPGGQILPQMKPTEELFHNKTIQDKQTKQENNGGALPLSLFSDLSEESNDILEPQDNLIHKPVSYPANGFISQGPGISIHDLISNLYSQVQPTSSVVSSDQKLAENGVHFSPQELDSNPPVDDDDWDDNSWEFKDACSETGFGEQLYSQTPGNVSQNPSEISHIYVYMEFYGTMRETLCFLLSHQLKEKEETQYSSSSVGDDGKVKALGNDVQEAYKLLQDNMVDKEALSKKHLEASTCLNEVLHALQDPKFKVIESQYSLSKKLQLAANDWRVASELLRHVISVLHILSLGSSDNQKVYVSTWSKLINVCNEELKYGALIWKRASENNLQHQSLSDHRGLQNILALGEIYKVAELLGLAAKLYMPWMLLSVSSNIFGLLDECRSLWSSSGLEQILKNISDNVDFGCYESAKALITSIENICDVDVVAVHDFVFNQQKSLCRLSLLPLDMLADLKTVLWNEEPYFVNLANLWANLISNHPPELPLLQVSQ